MIDLYELFQLSDVVGVKEIGSPLVLFKYDPPRL